MQNAIETKVSGKSRPTWMLLAIALPVGILLYNLSNGIEGLNNAALNLFRSAPDPTRLEAFTAHLTSHWFVPALCVYLLLKITKLGSWLAPNWLALAGLLLADSILVGYAIRGVYLASQGQPPYFGQDSNAILTPILTAGLSVGLATLVLSTLWHRYLVSRDSARRACKHMLSEV